MKKLIAMILVLMLALAFTACGSDDDDKPSGGKDKNPTEQQSPTKSGEKDKKTPTPEEDEPKYSFPGYTEKGTWPDKDMWAGMGLPEIPVADAGNVKISTKSYIYPLNAKDGVMFDCKPETDHFDEIVKALNDAGIKGTDRSESGDKKYEADYTKDGDPMRVIVTQYSSGKLNIFVQYMPND